MFISELRILPPSRNVTLYSKWGRYYQCLTPVQWEQTLHMGQERPLAESCVNPLDVGFLFCPLLSKVFPITPLKITNGPIPHSCPSHFLFPWLYHLLTSHSIKLYLVPWLLPVPFPPHTDECHFHKDKEFFSCLFPAIFSAPRIS